MIDFTDCGYILNNNNVDFKNTIDVGGTQETYVFIDWSSNPCPMCHF